jgi:hypothetical protein
MFEGLREAVDATTRLHGLVSDRRLQRARDQLLRILRDELTGVAVSSGVPSRRSGLPRAQLVKRLAGLLYEPPHPGRVDVPGQTALTRMPSFTRSTASARVQETTAPFDGQYAAGSRRPTIAATDAMLRKALECALPMNA